jgi:hypothetical protein
MNVGIVTSFIIAALLLISVMAWNARVSQNSGVVTLTQVTKLRAEGIGTTLSYDIRNLGQGMGSNPIVSADSNRFVFRLAMPGGGTQTITWFYDHTQPMTGTMNPNDRVLTRNINGTNTEIRFGVTRFTMSYLNASGFPTSILEDIRKIKILLKVESPTPYDNGNFISSYWETEVSPRALQ